MEKIGLIICTQQVFVSLHPEVRRKDISHALHPAEQASESALAVHFKIKKIIQHKDIKNKNKNKKEK